MDIPPIKSEADYSAALAEIERLWGAEENTDDGDKLDILLTLVDAYEKTHYPIAPPDPARIGCAEARSASIIATDAPPSSTHPMRTKIPYSRRRQ